jgi:hypothetical protein
MPTLLDGVNAVLKKRKLIEGDNEPLVSLTSGNRQLWIDAAVSSWNEAIDHLYTYISEPLPTEMAEQAIVLVEGTRSYDLPSDLVQIRWPLIDETNGYTIQEYPGGFDQMRRDQLQPGNYTGRPIYAAISPITDKLYLDRVPQSGDAGLSFNLVYDKNLSLALANDTFPFTDACYRAMIPVVAEFVRRDFDNEFDPSIVRINLGRAAQFVSKSVPRESWKSRGRITTLTDPYNA